MVVNLVNSSGTVLQTASFTFSVNQANSYVPVGGGSNTVIGTPVVLSLNFAIQPGTGYKLVQADND